MRNLHLSSLPVKYSFLFSISKWEQHEFPLSSGTKESWKLSTQGKNSFKNSPGMSNLKCQFSFPLLFLCKLSVIPFYQPHAALALLGSAGTVTTCLETPFQVPRTSLEKKGVPSYLTFQEIEASLLLTLSLPPESHWWDLEVEWRSEEELWFTFYYSREKRDRRQSCCTLELCACPCMLWLGSSTGQQIHRHPFEMSRDLALSMEL